MKALLIIIGVLSGFVCITVLIFSIKTLIETKRKAGSNIEPKVSGYKDEYCDGLDFTYKKTRKEQ